MPRRIPDSEIDEETAVMIAGSMLWHDILHSGLIEEDGGPEEVNMELCLDTWARCQEQDVKPDHVGTIAFVAGLIQESIMPDEDWDKCIDTALTLIAFVAIEKL